MKKSILIVGGGTAGISTAAMLRRKSPQLNIFIIDPADYHYYQPLWTLVGGGLSTREESKKTMKEVIPSGVTWVQDTVEAFLPETNSIKVSQQDTPLPYDYLVVCPGIQIDWDKIEGLKETLGKNGVCSNYDYNFVESTWKTIQATKTGNALFTYPNTPIKCGGAPQKIMYLAEEYFREHNLRDSVGVEFVSAGDKIFGVQKYKVALEAIIEKRGIKTSYGLNLVAVDGEKKIATFKNVATNELVEKPFEMLHAVPPMSAPDFIKSSPLAGEGGWVDVDKYTLQHNTYKNVFSLGDASSLPTSKTGAAVRKEVPVLVNNLLALISGKELKDKYQGYTSCPLVTGKGKVIMAEFDYDGNPAETFPFDQSKERYSMYLAKKYGIPFMYWNAMLKGYC